MLCVQRQLSNLHYLASLTSSFVSFFGCTLCLVPCGKCSALRVRRIRRAQYCLLQKHTLSTSYTSYNIQTSYCTLTCNVRLSACKSISHFVNRKCTESIIPTKLQCAKQWRKSSFSALTLVVGKFDP